MWKSNISRLDSLHSADAQHTLASDTSVLPITGLQGSGPNLGPVCKLPRGAKVAHLGSGFNEGTVKVACDGQFYFMFRQDLGL